MPPRFRRRGQQPAGAARDDEARNDEARNDEARGDQPRRPEPDTVHLADESHAWWARRDVEQAWTPKRDRGDDPDPLEVHLGQDWRSDFGLDAPPPPPGPTPGAGEAVPDLEATDPYELLGLLPGAAWEEVVVAHRSLARRYHPDKVATFDDEARRNAEEIMFRINAAYRDLKVRKGK